MQNATILDIHHPEQIIYKIALKVSYFTVYTMFHHRDKVTFKLFKMPFKKLFSEEDKCLIKVLRKVKRYSYCKLLKEFLEKT